MTASRAKLKKPPSANHQVLSNYFNSDPDTQFVLEGIDDSDMNKKPMSLAAVAAASTAAKRPGSKPLAWYLGSQKDSMERSETTSPADHMHPDMLRKDSVESFASSQTSAKVNDAKEDVGSGSGGKRRGKKGGRQRVKKISVNFTIAGSENKEAPRAASANVMPEANVNGAAPAASPFPVQVKDRKEDYWYYDPRSDGFYYEHNGSRGWRKRNPKIHGPAPMQVRVPENETFKVAGKISGNIGSSSSFKYYDPASDGYFFEMASVDGWRRRQPAPSVPAPPPAPAPLIERKPVPVHMPPMSRMYNAPHFPPLTGTSASSTTATPTPSPAGSFQPGPTMLTNAQLEEMIVRHPSLMASMQKQRHGGLFDNEPAPPSNSSTTSSLGSEELSTPPPQGSSQQEHSMFRQHFRRNHNGLRLQQSNSGSTLASNQRNVPQNTKTCFTDSSVGSADEPYEFYWSDNEKGSMSSYDDLNSQNEIFPGHSRVIGSRRPDSLRLGASANTERNQKSAWGEVCPEQQNTRFDVDKFIADLPSFNTENMINNLVSSPFPDTDALAWWNPFNNHALRTPVKSDKQAVGVDLENIWRQPCA